MDALCALLDCALGVFPCYFLFGCKLLPDVRPTIFIIKLHEYAKKASKNEKMPSSLILPIQKILQLNWA